MRGIESQPTWSLAAASTAVLSVAFGFAIWSCYSDGAAGWEERRLKLHSDVVRQRLWIMFQFLLFLGIGITAVGARFAIAMAGGYRFTMTQSWLMCGATAVMTCSIIGIAATSRFCQRLKRNWPWLLEICTALVPLVLVPAASRTSAAFVIAILFVCVGGETALLVLNRGTASELEQI
jgi:hypothetical protein